MAEPLKHFFDRALVVSLGEDLRAVQPSFPLRRFIDEGSRGLAELELLDRAAWITDTLEGALPPSFPEAARIIAAALPPAQPPQEGLGMAPFRYLPYVLFVQRRGLDHFEEAMALQHALTQRFTAEWSLRPYLLVHREATLARLAEWARDPSAHVRRLVSEGTRPRLPWAPRLRDFQANPEPVLALLERLKDDPHRYVQRSVANNLNDIAKDHPDRVVEVCRRWWVNAPPSRQWVVRHALRSLLKARHPGALALLGVGEAPRVRVADVRLTPRKVRLGEVARFRFTLVSTAARTQALLVDFAVHFVKARGGTSAKVFKLTKLELPPRGQVELGGKVSFEALTTRKAYAGEHRIELLVNGTVLPLATVEVTE